MNLLQLQQRDFVLAVCGVALHKAKKFLEAKNLFAKICSLFSPQNYSQT